MESSGTWTKIKEFISAHPVIVGLTSMLLVMVIFVWLALLCLDMITNHGEETTVPEVKNMTYSDAEEELAASGLVIEITDSVYDTSVAPGTVIESFPKAGQVVKAGKKVYVIVSSFSSKLIMISAPLVGISERQATSYLKNINGVQLKYVPSEYPGQVERAIYNDRDIEVGDKIPVDATVILEIGIPIEPEEEETDIQATTEDETPTESPATSTKEKLNNIYQRI